MCDNKYELHSRHSYTVPLRSDVHFDRWFFYCPECETFRGIDSDQKANSSFLTKLDSLDCSYKLLDKSEYYE